MRGAFLEGRALGRYGGPGMNAGTSPKYSSSGFAGKECLRKGILHEVFSTFLMHFKLPDEVILEQGLRRLLLRKVGVVVPIVDDGLGQGNVVHEGVGGGAGGDAVLGDEGLRGGRGLGSSHVDDRRRGGQVVGRLPEQGFVVVASPQLGRGVSREEGEGGGGGIAAALDDGRDISVEETSTSCICLALTLFLPVLDEGGGRWRRAHRVELSRGRQVQGEGPVRQRVQPVGGEHLGLSVVGLVDVGGDGGGGTGSDAVALVTLVVVVGSRVVVTGNVMACTLYVHKYRAIMWYVNIF